MIPARVLPAFALLCATAAVAQDQTHSLNDGRVTFRTPSAWTAMMEKKDGDPQAIAFQVPDPSAQGSDDAATVTVKTRALRSQADFAGFVQQEFEHSKSQPGYAVEPGKSDTSAHQYSVTRGKTKYAVRDTFKMVGDVAVEVRCQRPLLTATPASWTAQFDQSCAAVAASLAP